MGRLHIFECCVDAQCPSLPANCRLCGIVFKYWGYAGQMASDLSLFHIKCRRVHILCNFSETAIKNVNSRFHSCLQMVGWFDIVKHCRPKDPFQSYPTCGSATANRLLT